MYADDTTIPLPALYVEAVDPTTTYVDGRSFVKRMWLDTSTGAIGTLKKRNAANDGWDTLLNLDAPAITAHAASHQNGGADEINVAGLSGVLADPQVPITENVQDIAGAMATDSATIDFTYDDGAGTLTAIVKDASIGAAKMAPADTNPQTGTTYTLQASDNGKIVTLSNAAAITLTVPTGLGAGFNCLVVQLGAGQVTFSPSGTTVNNRQGHTKIAGQYGIATLAAYIANTFVLGGDTAV